eukprot:TRINITY_DN3660_c0_g1_i1.p2 TRINITY_DN3660_c0_g1~~TRINITY_DN3660_c0_g1_i1.p2  ORF type:complete len:103 (-),score=16.03 TRINITY_DN3660_c0_g1_i1:102-410(-)
MGASGAGRGRSMARPPRDHMSGHQPQMPHQQGLPSQSHVNQSSPNIMTPRAPSGHPSNVSASPTPSVPANDTLSPEGTNMVNILESLIQRTMQSCSIKPSET